jgi:hypothetical protein
LREFQAAAQGYFDDMLFLPHARTSAPSSGSSGTSPKTGTQGYYDQYGNWVPPNAQIYIPSSGSGGTSAKTGTQGYYDQYGNWVPPNAQIYTPSTGVPSGAGDTAALRAAAAATFPLWNVMSLQRQQEYIDYLLGVAAVDSTFGPTRVQAAIDIAAQYGFAPSTYHRVTDPWMDMQNKVVDPTILDSWVENGYQYFHWVDGSVTRIAYTPSRNWGQYIPMVTRGVMTVIAGIGGGPIGAGAMTYALETGAQVEEGRRPEWLRNLIPAAMAAAATYYASGGSWEGAAGMTAEQAAERFEGFVSSYAKKWLINQAMGAILDRPENGQLTFSYEGADDHGLISTLASLMGDLAPQSSRFAFHAREGLDYVPSDNYRAVLHEGEAVLNKEEARSWRNQKGGGDFIVNVNYYGTVIEERQAAQNIATLIYPYTKKLEAWGH